MTAVGTRARLYDRMGIQRTTKSSHKKAEIKLLVSVSHFSRENRSTDIFLRTQLRRGLVFLKNHILWLNNYYLLISFCLFLVGPHYVLD